MVLASREITTGARNQAAEPAVTRNAFRLTRLRSKLRVEWFSMSNPEDAWSQSARTQLEEKLREVDERLRRELRARGFDPAQDENLALTGPLAKLYMERENLREELETRSGVEDSTVE